MEIIPPDAVSALLGIAFEHVGSSSAFSAAGATAVAIAYEKFVKARKEKTHRILCEEIGKGGVTSFEAAVQDDVIAAFLRIAQAVRDSASFEAIRLMAKIMVGQMQRDQLHAGQFNKYASLLVTLSRDEIFAITCLYMARQVISEDDPFRVWEMMVEKVVPDHFSSATLVHATLSSASRSGLVTLGPELRHAPLTYMPSPLMDELVQLADFQDALRSEGCRMPGDDGRREPHF